MTGMFAVFAIGSRKSANSSALRALMLMGAVLVASAPQAQAARGGSNGRGSRAPEVQVPVCIGEAGETLAVDNDRALELKETAPVGKPYRLMISGVVTRSFGDTCKSSGTCHEHFEIQIQGERGKSGPVEVIYNEDFGTMREPRVGAKITTCGDFINANRQNGRYEPSPSGAIIHWVHRSNCMDHEHGFVHNDDDGLLGFGEDRKARECKPGVARRQL